MLLNSEMWRSVVKSRWIIISTRIVFWISNRRANRIVNENMVWSLSFNSGIFTFTWKLSSHLYIRGNAFLTYWSNRPMALFDHSRVLPKLYLIKPWSHSRNRIAHYTDALKFADCINSQFVMAMTSLLLKEKNELKSCERREHFHLLVRRR